MAAGEIDILVATQAAAKGHNFPNLTLVGVVDADLGLRGGDLRAAERTYQLLAQATGRAGRKDRPGRALLQTWAPEHPVMQALAGQDRDAFVAAEMAEREAAGLPPFGRLAAVIVSGPDPVALEAYVRAFAAAAPNAEGVDVFGPADAPLGLVRGRRRKRFLVRADRPVDLQGFLAAWRARVKPPAVGARGHRHRPLQLPLGPLPRGASRARGRVAKGGGRRRAAGGRRNERPSRFDHLRTISERTVV